jgi:hypothetical protein
MGTKFLSVNGKAVDKNGKEHIVTVVGKYSQKTENKVEVEKLKVVDVDKPTKEHDGTLIINKKQKVRKLRYAYSICHTDDIELFNEEIGVELAKKRINNNPLGELQTTFITSLCNDQIDAILKSELEYICQNIDKFIEKL